MKGVGVDTIACGYANMQGLSLGSRGPTPQLLLVLLNLGKSVGSRGRSRRKRAKL